ncbi:MAG: citrate/2-methylcitrate synthase, partial [Thiotrichaceae bacterium]
MSIQTQTQVNKDIHRGLVGVYFDKTTVTDIQGHRGELRYRGYNIDGLVTNPCYEDVAYLLIHGQWPLREQSKV